MDRISPETSGRTDGESWALTMSCAALAMMFVLADLLLLGMI